MFVNIHVREQTTQMFNSKQINLYNLINDKYKSIKTFRCWKKIIYFNIKV